MSQQDEYTLIAKMVKKLILSVILVGVFSATGYCQQYEADNNNDVADRVSCDYDRYTDKPSSFIDVLRGTLSYDFGLRRDADLNFPPAYVFNQITLWMKAIRPGISFGMDVNSPSTTHLRVLPKFMYKPQYDGNGMIYWKIYDVQIEFQVAGLGYVYRYSLPNTFYIYNNDLNDNALYQKMLKYIYGYIVEFDENNVLKMDRIYSTLTENFLYENPSIFHLSVEGIYEDMETKEKVAFLLDTASTIGHFYYLSDAPCPGDWVEGEVKGLVEKTGVECVYRVSLWADSDFGKPIMRDGYMSVKDGFFELSLGGLKRRFIKLFPLSGN